MKQGEINMNTEIIEEFEIRHKALMTYKGDDMISFVISSTELQRVMLGKIKLMNEQLERLTQEKELSK